MLSTKPTRTLAIAGVLFAAAAGGIPSTAAAHTPKSGAVHHSGEHAPAGACHASIAVTPNPLTVGDPVVVFGGVSCTSGTVAGQTAALFQQLPGGHGFTQVQSTTTDAGGHYEFSPIDGVNVDGAWFVRVENARSRTQQVRVAAPVTLSGPPEDSQLLTGATSEAQFTGTAAPSDAGYAVLLERQDSPAGDAWHPVGAPGEVGSEGAFTIQHAFLHPGPASIRVLIVNRAHGNPHNSPGASNVLDYEISQPQSSHVTVEGLPAAIEAGQSLTVAGTVAGGAHRTVTLRAAGAHGNFLTVATVEADAGGKFTFPAQSPTVNTLYRVRAGNVSSTTQVVGVKDALTISAPQMTIPAGQPLAFSGTVTPAHSGHTIYLERQNASGMGFHVVQVGTVGAGSAYTIAHAVYDTGSAVFRVSIPGGPDNQGAASAPLTIDVTPTLAEALLPEAPGNSSQPVGLQP